MMIAVSRPVIATIRITTTRISCRWLWPISGPQTMKMHEDGLQSLYELKERTQLTRTQMEPVVNFWPVTRSDQKRSLTNDPIWPDPEVFDPVTWPGRFDRSNISARSSKLCVANLQQHGFQTTCWSVVVSCVHIHYKIRLNSRIFAQTCNRAYVHCIAEQLCTDPLPDQTSKIVDLWPSDPKTWFHVWTADFSDYRTRDLMLLCWQRSAVGARPRER